MADAPPPPPAANDTEDKKPAPFQFNFGAPPAAPAGGVTGLMANMKLAAGVSDDDEDDSDEEFVPGADGEEEDGVIALEPYELIRVAKLKELNDERAKLVKQYTEERAALEKKYQALYTPFYEERARIVKGEQDVTPAEVGLEEAQLTIETSSKGIQRFWLMAMNNLENVQEMIEEGDVEALSFLRDVKCVDNDDYSGFTLEFHFAENPFFTNEVLTKTYEVSNLLKDDQDPCLENVKGCEITWKENMCLTHTTKRKKQKAKKGKHAGQVRYVTQKIEKESFFNWFAPPDMDKLKKLQKAANAAASEEAIEEAEEMLEKFHMDYTIAASIRLILVPNAVLCFTGELVDDSDDEGEEGEEDSESDDE